MCNSRGRIGCPHGPTTETKRRRSWELDSNSQKEKFIRLAEPQSETRPRAAELTAPGRVSGPEVRERAAGPKGPESRRLPLFGPLSLHAMINNHCVEIIKKTWQETFGKKGQLRRRLTFNRHYTLKDIDRENFETRFEDITGQEEH